MSNRGSGAPGAPKEKEVNQNSLVLIQANVPLFIRDWLDEFAGRNNRTRSNVINIILQAAYNARDQPVAEGKVIGIKILGELPATAEEEEIKATLLQLQADVNKTGQDLQEHHRPGSYILEIMAKYQERINRLQPKINGKYPELKAQLDHLQTVLKFWCSQVKGGSKN